MGYVGVQPVEFLTTSSGFDLNGTDLILDSDDDTKISAGSDDVISIETGGSERFKVDSTDVTVATGNIVFGGSNKGIYLGVTSATAANLLDDYEEGVHNAVATTTDDTSTALGISGEDALQYVKIGGMVYIHGSIAVGGASATGAIRVSLPFAPTSLSEKADISYFNITLDAGDGSLASGQFVGEVNGAVGAEIRVYATDQTSFQSDSANSMDASCSVGISGFYYSA
tara:strand:+ start:221 stop:901 length:681 start_codon:yes stop_codon:yes gene_type:complete